MKIAALAVMLFGLATALYGIGFVVPKYEKANQAWVSSRGENHERLETERYELRSRAQSYAFGAILPALLALALGVVTRKKAGFPPMAVLAGGAVLTLVLVGGMQMMGNIF